MISVIIPLYNKEGSIAQALDSVMAQECQDFEVVVVDDGSTDGGVAVVENYGDPRIRLVRQENAGVSAARNRGIEEAKGEYVAFLDADDVWMPGFLSEIVALQREFPQCRAQATNYVFNSNGVKSPTILRKIPFGGEKGVLMNYFEVASCSHPPVWTSAVCIERRLLQEIGGFPVGIKSGEDLLTWARVAVRTDWAYSMKEMAQYNQGEGYDKKNLPPRRQDGGDPVGKELKRIYAEYPSIIGLRKYISHWHKMRASVAVRYGERLETLKEVICSLKYNVMNFKVMPFAVLAVLPHGMRKYIISKY